MITYKKDTGSKKAYDSPTRYEADGIDIKAYNEAGESIGHGTAAYRLPFPNEDPDTGSEVYLAWITVDKAYRKYRIADAILRELIVWAKSKNPDFISAHATWARVVPWLRRKLGKETWTYGAVEKSLARTSPFESGFPDYEPMEMVWDTRRQNPKRRRRHAH